MAENKTENKAMSIEQVEDKWRQGYADVTGLYKGNMDAMLAASQAMLGGYQALSAEMLSFMQGRMKTSLETGKKLASCSSPDSMVELQVDFAQSAYKEYADELKKLNDLTGKIMNDAFAPISAQAKSVPEKFAENVAA